ncbi:YggT family protein [Actinoplanes aureus]|jgi:YggT family protein|uniref:YggT family protein n=1 Tax=Actinoplanes aureus TaxID=2792083 RepID=A0A931C5V1_9ACTN|nr:YggT family protein [Actinoplanes aureus]MBG0562789.1 YggT family protein [Actinoplanes aureus]
MGLLALVNLVLLVVQLLLVARAVLDWSVALAGPAMPGSFRSRATSGVTAVTEPILAPVRKVLPPLRVGGVSIDLAFIVLFLGISVLRALI